MSAIIGVLTWSGDPAPAGRLDAMLRSLEHRGPDGHGIVESDCAAFGHLLLRVDESTPRPVSRDGITLVMDGRIDNLEFLRRWLGRSARLPLDTTEDVVWAAYRRWETEFPRWVLGDFAMALWDSSRGRMLLVRDPVGVKSLYYHRDEQRIVFASEIKGVLAGPDVPRRACDRVLDEYEHSLFRSRERTFFDGVERVLPAEIICFEKGRMRRSTYWHPGSAAPVRSLRHESHLSRFRKLFEEAVACRLPRSGRAAIALSGGLDSSSIASVAADAIQKGKARAEIRAWSSIVGGYPNEKPYFEAVCEKWNLPSFVLDAAEVPLMPHVPSLARELEMPFIDWIDPNLYHHLFRGAAGDGAKVMLMGVWGDDLMMGLAYVGDLLREGKWGEFVREWSAWDSVGLGRLSLRRAIRFLFFPNADGPIYRTCNQRELYTLLFRPYQGLVLESLDKGAAAQGLEIRLPFLDRRLIDFVFSIPPEARASVGVGKRLMREGLRDVLPECVGRRMDKGAYWGFWHSKLLDAGMDGTWEECVLAWKKGVCDAWKQAWFENPS